MHAPELQPCFGVGQPKKFWADFWGICEFWANALASLGQLCVCVFYPSPAMDDNLYDEFGNYIGPELGSDGDSDQVRACFSENLPLKTMPVAVRASHLARVRWRPIAPVLLKLMNIILMYVWYCILQSQSEEEDDWDQDARAAPVTSAPAGAQSTALAVAGTSHV